MNLPKRTVIDVPLRHPTENRPVPIVADALIATAGMARGRTIPLLILDTSSRPDIETMIRAHRHLPPGDVTSGWSFKKRWLRFPVPVLYLMMERPSRCFITIEFDLVGSQGALIDLILWARGVYLQAGRPGDRLSTTMDELRILVEVVPSDVFSDRFRPLYEKAIYRRFRRKGIPRSRARDATREFLTEFRGIAHRHFPLGAHGKADGRPPESRDRKTGADAK